VTSVAVGRVGPASRARADLILAYDAKARFADLPGVSVLEP
jgi:hypothetical protein